MALSVNHTFVTTLPDNPADTAAGKIVGSNWNAGHSVSGTVDMATLNTTNGAGGTSNFLRADGTWSVPGLGTGVAIIDKGSTSGTVTFNMGASSKQKLTVTGLVTVAFTGFAPAGFYSEVEIQLVNGGTNMTWPPVNWLVGDGTTSTAFSAMGVTLNAAGSNFVVVWSTDGGVTLYGRAA